MGVHARQTKVGINVATSGSWGVGAAVATAVGAGDGHYVTDDLGVQLRMVQNEHRTAGQNFVGSVQSSFAEAITVAIPTYLHYYDVMQNVLWALTLGTGSTTPAGATTSQYVGTFEPATNKTGRYATIVRDKSQYISEVPGVKFSGFTLSMAEGGRMMITWNGVGDVEKVDSTTNTATQIAALTFPTLGYCAFLDDCAVSINTQGGAAFSTSDVIRVAGLSVRFTQPLDTKHISGQTTIIEPEENGFPEIEVSLEFPRFDATTDDYFARHRDTTALKAQIVFTGPTITGTYNYGLKFEFPNLYVSEYAAPVPGGADQIAPRVTLKALSTTTAPTGMTGVTVPLRVTTTGISSSNPFV